MLKALVFKELRETMWIGIAAFIAYMATIAGFMGYSLFPYDSTTNTPVPIPFLNNDGWGSFIIISIVLSITLGLWQTVTESRRGTWLMLLHRPISRRRLICVKLAVGIGLYLAVSGVPILIYTFWAAAPDTHASPFFWWMSAWVWQLWLITALVYLGGFLTGIRPGRWLGTRLFPILASGLCTLIVGVAIFGLRRWFLGLAVFFLICAVFVGIILYVARMRDFS
jgi:hypothetical protein